MSKRRQGGSGASRDRLEEMITMVQSYRGWSQKQVAEALDRNVHALVPDSGNPKLDLVVKLSDILDWPLEMVVADLKEAEREAAAAKRAKDPALETGATDVRRPSVPETAKAIIHRAWELCEAEKWEDVLTLTDPESFDGVEGLDAESRGWLGYYRQVALESAGQYLAAIDCCRWSLESTRHDSAAAWRLRTALAYLLLTIGSATEADGVAVGVIGELGTLESSDPLREQRALAHYVRGLARRSLAVRGDGFSAPLLAQAREHIEKAALEFEDHASYGGSVRNLSMTATARCVAREIDVLLGDASAAKFVTGVVLSLDIETTTASMDSNAAESLGWRCLVAARVIIAFRDQIEDPDRMLAILTNKADEVAERLGHWALRERLFAIEHLHRVLIESTGEALPIWNLDEEDLRTLMGTMGRFPRFRKLGWKILTAARRERSEGGV